MTRSHERSLHELYRRDPERADAVVFGRVTDQSRRGFLGGAGLAAMGAAIGLQIPFAARMPSGLVPVALAQAPAAAPRTLTFPGKAPGLTLLQERPLVAETPEHMLDDAVTPTEKFFVRNNGLMPENVPADPNAWRLVIDGEVNTPLTLTLGEMRQRFPIVTFQLQMECGGNGRAQFQPEARGNQWGNGAIGNAVWTGVRLKDVLNAAGLKPSAVYTANFGADPHLSGATDRQSISRGVPVAKAMEDHTILAFEMNGQPLSLVHGGPLRILCPGWPGSVSHKWITRIWIRDREHDGPGMTGTNYRMPRTPMVPGAEADNANMAVMESMPLRSIITSHANGTELAAGTRQVALRGAAWAGEKTVRAVDVSLDFGQTWRSTTLGQPANKYAWQRWETQLTLPSRGYFEIWARGMDQDGTMQPHTPANWNPQGYGANAMHRVAVLVRS